MELQPPTREQIEAARTPAGGWTKAQLEEWGVPWPPPQGWKQQLELEADRISAARQTPGSGA